MALRHESLARGVVEVSDERTEEPADVERTDRLAMEPELRPRQDLGQLLERAETARQRQERVGQLGHDGLPLVERRDDPELRDAAMGQLPIDEARRDHAGHATAGRQRRVGDRAHQPEPAAAVDELDPASCQLRPDRAPRHPRSADRCRGSPRRRRRCCEAWPTLRTRAVAGSATSAGRPRRDGRSRSSRRPSTARASARRAAPIRGSKMGS